MPNIDFNNGTYSFWLGFITATIFWWLVIRIKPLIPQWNRQIKQFLNVISQRNFSSVDDAMRRDIIQQAQRMHIAAPLFALDELLVQPWLLVPPGGQDPAFEETNPSVAGRLVPYLPDWPELAASYGVPVITPAQAVLSGRNVAIIGHPGSGKTVALAQLATQLAREEIFPAGPESPFPLYMHANELDLSQDYTASGPQTILIKTLTDSASVWLQPQIPRYLNALFGKINRPVILLLDGLDELPPSRLKEIVRFLEQLIETQPRVQVIVSASVNYLDGLTGLGFVPLALAAWKPAQREALLKKWNELWSTQIQPDTKVSSKKPAVDPVIIEYWLSGENVYTNPLEWTLRLWGAYAGDLSGNNVIAAIEACLKRYLPDPAHWSELEDLAYIYLQQQAVSMQYRTIEQLLSRATSGKHSLPMETSVIPEAVVAQEAAVEKNLPGQAMVEPLQGKKPRGGSITSQGERIIGALREAGILIQQADHQIRFTNPLFLGFLSSRRLTPEDQSALAQNLQWSAAQVALQFTAAHSETLDWMHALVSEADPPLYRSLLTAARWLRDAPANAEWRFSLMRALVTHIQDEQVPFSVRVCMMTAFYLSRDPSVVKLIKQLLASRSALVRRIALLGCGAVGSPQCIDDVLALLANADSDVRNTACMALAAIPEEAAFNAVVQVLLSGDEEIRQTAAEALALHEGDGYQVLREAAQENDLLTRRAAVYGLLLVPAPWAKKALEQIAVEDGQWIVRNAAAQALEVLNNKPSLPEPLPPPSQSPWLITFASKFGMGILPGHPATDVLLNVLKSGTAEEQVAALYYLRDQPDQQVIGSIYQLLDSGSVEVKEHALNALWWMSASGVNLPSPDISLMRKAA